MSNYVRSIIETGLRGLLVDIECHITNGLPAIVIVGFANRSIDEAKERLRGAFSSSGLVLPRKRITLNLAPGDIPKDGTGFDLAMALAILLADQPLLKPLQPNEIIIGELSLDGRVRPIRGIIGKLLAAQSMGIDCCYIPTANLSQARLVPGLELVAIDSLQALYEHLLNLKPLNRHVSGHGLTPEKSLNPQTDLQLIAGQGRGKRALEVAAAGGHNLLLSGPPGTGKSMLAKALPGLLPPLSPSETLAVTHLHSLASLQFEHIITERPFRSPHHTASQRALIGGGSAPTPGEISLSHHGVLFLDELPEFRRASIEALRQPLEDGTITIARSRQSVLFPAEFLLVATANPCPCGYYGTSKPCQCLAHHIAHYQRKLSGPILDRIDLYVEVEPTEHQQLLAKNSSAETSATVAKRVLVARHLQLKRQKVLNSRLDNRAIKRYAKLTTEAKVFLDISAQRMELSGRAYLKIVKVARTIADLANSQQVSEAHIIEALQFRHQPVDPL